MSPIAAYDSITDRLVPHREGEKVRHRIRAALLYLLRRGWG